MHRNRHARTSTVEGRSRWVASLQRCVARHPGRILVCFAVLALACASQLPKLHVDSTVDNLLLDDDESRIHNRAAKLEFSDDEVIVVGLDGGRPLDAALVREASALSKRLASVNGVEEVLDITTIEDIRGDADSLDASPLIDLEEIDENIAAVRARAIGHRLYRRNIMSDDGGKLLFFVFLDTGESAAERKREVADDVLSIVESWQGPSAPLYATGGPALEYELHTGMTRDLALLMPVALLIMAVLIGRALGRMSAVGLVSIAIAWSELATLGFMAAAGIPISTVTSAVPIMTLAVSSTYAIYFLGMLDQGGNDGEPAVAAIALLVRPAFLSAASTVIGFGSLALLGIEGIDELGVTLVVAIVSAYAAAMLLLPAVARLAGIRPQGGSSKYGRPNAFVRAGLRFASRPRTTFIVFAIGVAAAVAGVVRLEATSEPVAFLDPDGTVVRGNDFVRESVGGTTILRMVVDTERAGGALDPAVLRFLDRTVRAIERAPHVVRTQSVLDYFYLLDAAMRPEHAATAVPETRELAAQYLLLYENGGSRGDIRHYLNYDRSALSVTVKARTQTTGATLVVADAMQAAAAAAPAGVEVHVVGNATLMARALESITRGMIAGLVSASVLICIVTALILGSLRLALIAMIPNVAPVVCGIGLLGWLGEPLSVGTSIIGAMVLGLAVDDTAHVLGHLQTRSGLREVYRTVGPSLALTSSALGVGFSVLIASRLALVATIGWTMLLTMSLAFLADVLVLPSLLVVSRHACIEPARAPTRTSPVGMAPSRLRFDGEAASESVLVGISDETSQTQQAWRLES
jgi:predicted RND superfamily exporter protein